MPVFDWAILILASLAFLTLVYWLRVLSLARQGVRLLFENLLFAAFAFLVCTAYLYHNYPWTERQDEILSGSAALVLFFALSKFRRRSRYIPKAVRRAVIARDLKGEHFNSRKHNIDHIWPFSKGGSNTTDNLRILSRSENLRKRAKRPRFWKMW